ncbi:MAG: 2Fe-2S iron-sulfur cluster binding domain-containing protein [Proteobacteria bacterium]|nr:2Fe-2S iron-sulfur cluster binding domain-containing protein [Pseudomonadota bacterium]MCP4915589.1 2Fe-2S iron-sulfur cluster binding domain-containing protein [Pseudomonadota bacterium]
MRIRCEPSGREVEVEPGESVYAALRRVGVPIASTCEADGICGRCAIQVLHGALEPPSELETSTRLKQVVEGRLACLVEPREDLTVTTSYW